MTAYCPGKELIFRSEHWTGPSVKYNGIVLRQSKIPCENIQGNQWTAVREDLCVRHKQYEYSTSNKPWKWEVYPHNSISECSGAAQDAGEGEFADPMVAASYYNSVVSWMCGYALTGGYTYGFSTIYDSSSIHLVTHGACAAVHFDHLQTSHLVMDSVTRAVALNMVAPDPTVAPTLAPSYPTALPTPSPTAEISKTAVGTKETTTKAFLPTILVGNTWKLQMHWAG